MTINRRRRCHEMRTQGMGWREIGEALNPSSLNPRAWAFKTARKYALSRGLAWPMSRRGYASASRDRIGSDAYQMRTEGEKWKTIGELLLPDKFDPTRAAFNCAKAWAQANDEPWPARQDKCGRAEYEAAKRAPSVAQAARDMECSEGLIRKRAKAWAQANGLKWPIRPATRLGQTKENSRGEQAYTMLARGKSITVAAGHLNTSTNAARTLARTYARRRSLPWPPQQDAAGGEG